MRLLFVLLATCITSCASMMYTGVQIDLNPKPESCEYNFEKYYSDKPVTCWCMQTHQVGDRIMVSILEVKEELCFKYMMKN